MKAYWKWLLLIPVIAGAVIAGYLITGWLSQGDSSSTDDASGQNQAIQLEITNKQQVIDQTQALVDSDAGDALALENLGNAYLELGLLQTEDGDVNGSFRSYRAAADVYQRYLQLKPDDADVRIDLGYTYYNLLMFEVAERELKAVTVAAPSNQRGWHVYGVVLSRLEKTDEAVAAWQHSYDLDPNSTIGQESKQFMEQAGSGMLQAP